MKNSAGTGPFPGQRSNKRDRDAATDAIPMTGLDAEHPIRCVMSAPWEMPTANTRVGSIGSSAFSRSTTAVSKLNEGAVAEGKNFDSSNCGLRAYDNWIKGLIDAQDGTPGFGAAYNAACWSD